MYAIQAVQDPKRIDVTMNGALDAGEIVRCISQAAALAEAGTIHQVCADVSSAEPCGLDHSLVIAALRSRASQDIQIAVIASERAARITQKILTRAGFEDDQARIFTVRAEAEAWLGRVRRSASLAGTDRRHMDLATTLLSGSKTAPVKTAQRKSVA